MMYFMPPAEVGGIFFMRQLAYANQDKHMFIERA